MLRLLALVSACGLGCASYQGTARDVSREEIAARAGFLRVDGIDLVRQKGIKDCGSAALSTVLRYWQPYGAPALERAAIDEALRRNPEEGLSARALRDYALRQGFSAYVLEGAFSDLVHEVRLGRPVIVGVHKPLTSGKVLAHYEIFIGYHPNERQVLTLDPAHGLRQNGLAGFLSEWQQAGRVTLVVMPDGEPSSTN